MQPTKTLPVTQIQRGYALVTQAEKTLAFFYARKKKESTYQKGHGFNYFQQMKQHDNQTLMMSIMNQKKRASRQFDFFIGTKNIRAKKVHKNFIFLAAQTLDGHLKIAVLDENYKLRFTHVAQNLSVLKIYNIFSHIDGSYSLALQVANNKQDTSYFNRGNGVSSVALLKFSPLLHPMSQHIIGDVKLDRLVDIIKDSQGFYYVFAQKHRDISLYQHDFSKNSTIKTSFTLPKESSIQKVSTDSLGNFYIAGNHNSWFIYEKKSHIIRSYDLAKIKHATIKSIHKLSDNSMLISGYYPSPQGDEDIFIHNYSPKQSLLWENYYRSKSNDRLISQELTSKNILLKSLIYTIKKRQSLAIFKLDYQGKRLK